MHALRSRLIVAVIMAATAACLAWTPVAARHGGASAVAIKEIATAALPREAQQTLEAIKHGGPHTFERDGVVFGNYERLLPPRNRGYYHEYTVPTPGVKNRGARRVIAGANAEYYYTDDHYRTFMRIRE